MRYRITLLLIGCILSAIQLQSNTAQPALRKLGSSFQLPTHETQSALSDLAIYKRLFNRIRFLDVVADEMNNDHKDSSQIRTQIQRDLDLSLSQMAPLKQIAYECLAQVKTCDLRANAIISQIRAQYPQGKTNGVRPPQPPAELYSLNRQKDALYLNARLALQTQFGAQAFSDFEVLLRSSISKHTQTRQFSSMR